MTAPTDTITWGYVAPSTIDVYFLSDGSGTRDLNFATFTGTNGHTFGADGWTSYEQQQAQLAFQQFSDVANVTFNFVTDIAQADFVMVTGSAIEVQALGYWSIGGGTIAVDSVNYNVDGVGVFNWQGQGWDPSGATGGLEVGGYAFVTLIHEIAHGLGLAHPHDNGGGSTIMSGVTGPFGSYGDFDLNQGVYTTMSYNDGWQTAPHGASPSNAYGWQGSLMALDIAVLQSIYGANPSHNAGNTIYELPTSNGPGTYYQAIWDTGGSDSIVYGGSGNAVIDLRPATLQYEEGGGGFISYVAGIHGGFTIANGVVIENAFGGSGNDMLIGNSAANVLAGGAGNDTLYGGANDDTLYGGNGADSLWGQAGNDLIYGGLGNDTIGGGDGNDQLFGGGNDDTIYGGNGNDILSGEANADVLYGGNGNDFLAGGAGHDSLFGGAHDDTLYGGDGDDSLWGQTGNDLIYGGLGNDLIGGGDGNDQLFGGGNNDTIYGGNGNDAIYGEAGDDFLFGGTGHDVLAGGAGNDQLFGEMGFDQLYGGAGNDILNGGAGNDTLFGGSGADIFVFQPGGGHDTVGDFQDNIDLLDFSLFGFASEASVLSLAAQSGGAVFISLPDGGSVLLSNFNLALLDAGDIIV